jgi:hypothetical protein
MTRNLLRLADIVSNNKHISALIRLSFLSKWLFSVVKTIFNIFLLLELTQTTSNEFTISFIFFTNFLKFKYFNLRRKSIKS